MVDSNQTDKNFYLGRMNVQRGVEAIKSYLGEGLTVSYCDAIYEGLKVMQNAFDNKEVHPWRQEMIDKIDESFNENMASFGTQLSKLWGESSHNSEAARAYNNIVYAAEMMSMAFKNKPRVVHVQAAAHTPLSCTAL